MSGFSAERCSIRARFVVSRGDGSATIGLCPVPERINLIPFPPPALPGFNGTMESLTPCNSSRCPCVLYLFINTSILEEVTGSPTFTRYLCLHTRFSDPGEVMTGYPLKTPALMVPSESSEIIGPLRYSVTRLNHFNLTASGLQTLCLRLTRPVTWTLLKTRYSICWVCIFETELPSVR